MDVSQLCSNSSVDSARFSPTLNSGVVESEQAKRARITPSSLDYILSPSEDARKEKQQAQTISNLKESNELVFDQCSKLCESIWQLKLQHKSMSNEDRDSMINSLSISAQYLFKTIQSSEQWCSRDNTKKRDSNANSLHYDEEEEDEDDEEDDDDEERRSTNTDTPSYKAHAEYELIRQARNLQDANSRPKYRRRNRRSMVGQKCHSCSTTETPEWRRGPDGARTLCNACGLHYSKLLRKGSIVVQTNNYLLTEVSPSSQQQQQSSATISSTAASAISNNHNNMNRSAPPASIVNFPFVLMDPKNDKRQLPQIRTSATATSTLPSLPPTSSSYTPTIVNINNSNNFPSPQSPSPPLQHNLNRALSSNNGSQNSITPLRIHQWKQQQQ